VIKHVVEIGPHVRVKRGKGEMRELVANLVHRSQHALKPDQLAA
jgi:hypothetical protein